MKTLAEILARMDAIAKELEDPNADIEALNKEFEELEEKRALLEKKENIIKRAGANQAVSYERMANVTGAEQKAYTPESEEYRRAYLKTLAVDKEGRKIFGDLTKEERDAFTFTTANTGEVVPTIILNRIKEMVPSMSSLYDDATKSGIEQGFRLIRHTAITQGDADVTAEGVANDDEEDEFDYIDLPGVEIKKHANVTRKMRFQSIEAFEDWLVTHIANRILVAKDKVLIARLNDASTGIDSGNIITGTYSDETVREAFSLIKSNGVKRVYANNKTIYNGLAGIEDGSGRKAFIPSAMEDAITQGRLYGAGVKLNENIPDNVAYFGVPADLIANDFEALAFMRDTNAESWVETFSGYSLFDGGLENPYAFVKVTFTSEASEDEGEGE